MNKKESARLRDIVPVCIASGAIAALSLRAALMFGIHRNVAAIQNAIASEAVFGMLLVAGLWAAGRNFSAVAFVALALLVVLDALGGGGVLFFLMSPSVFAYLLFRLIYEPAVVAGELSVVFLGMPLATIVVLLLLIRP